jgi:hypothetical protein
MSSERRLQQPSTSKQATDYQALTSQQLATAKKPKKNRLAKGGFFVQALVCGP